MGNFVRDHCVYAPSQWEMALYCDTISHWLGAYTMILVLNMYKTRTFWTKVKHAITWFAVHHACQQHKIWLQPPLFWWFCANKPQYYHQKQNKTKQEKMSKSFKGHTIVFVGFPRCKKCCPHFLSWVCFYHCWDYYSIVVKVFCERKLSFFVCPPFMLAY